MCPKAFSTEIRPYIYSLAQAVAQPLGCSWVSAALSAAEDTRTGAMRNICGLSIFPGRCGDLHQLDKLQGVELAELSTAAGARLKLMIYSDTLQVPQCPSHWGT